MYKLFLWTRLNARKVNYYGIKILVLKMGLKWVWNGLNHDYDQHNSNHETQHQQQQEEHVETWNIKEISSQWEWESQLVLQLGISTHKLCYITFNILYIWKHD